MLDGVTRLVYVVEEGGKEITIQSSELSVEGAVE
jgi:hypothetical protein